MLSIMKKGNSVNVTHKHQKNWKRIKFFNKYYRLNPIAEQLYSFIGSFFTLVIGISSFLFLYIVLAV